MIGSTLSERAYRSRLLTIGDDLTVTLDEAPSAYMACSLRSASVSTTGNPRATEPGEVRWTQGPTLTAGSRLSFWSGEEWELLEAPSPVRVNNTRVGWWAPALPTAGLYPRVAALQELGGAPTAVTVPLSLYQPSERDTDRGNYEDFAGDAPLDLAEHLTIANRQLAIGTETFKIARATPDYETPRVSLELRRG